MKPATPTFNLLKDEAASCSHGPAARVIAAGSLVPHFANAKRLAPKARFNCSLGQRPRFADRFVCSAESATQSEDCQLASITGNALSALKTFLCIYLGRCPRLELNRAFGVEQIRRPGNMKTQTASLSYMNLNLTNS
jgi:hypothetical protein